ncbi:gamma-glutamyl-gamma-aminobutyrate hydrolase family protein [Micromonospora sp. M51]|uniref:gamma-glutamyl-gamma-aminobutyrate hydrolase family protein n=1 Tax=Micromonospora TaxID=1873 RepID=UPI001B36F970|nr:gamma-glutamyl-gamma-aminobutyrate hydrolase family protein [Micromonospora sp. M51]MBQ1010610.1 gamma-glutamyl-gamma-aminobutyrate hydrolase family protein [Micromonospora sp. M51]
MTCVAVTQRVVVDPAHGVRSDALDQRWWPFLRSCGLTGLPVPNDVDSAVRLVRVASVDGLLLTGGNDLAELGGEAPDRDRTESALLDVAHESGLPVVGVCRGMQMLLRRFGASLHRVTGHVTERQPVWIDGGSRVVNSYHNWGATEIRSPLRAWATGPGGVIKAIRHETEPVLGLMWHPERLPIELAGEDRRVLRAHFGAEP